MTVKSVNIRTKCARAVAYSQSHKTRNLIGTVVHLLEPPTPLSQQSTIGLADPTKLAHERVTGSPIPGASCVSWLVCLLRFKPCAGWCTNGLFLSLLLAVLVLKSQVTNHGNSRRFIVHCDGYSFALVVNKGSFEIPRPTLLVWLVGR